MNGCCGPPEADYLFVLVANEWKFSAHWIGLTAAVQLSVHIQFNVMQGNVFVFLWGCLQFGNIQNKLSICNKIAQLSLLKSEEAPKGKMPKEAFTFPQGKAHMRHNNCLEGKRRTHLQLNWTMDASEGGKSAN